MQKLGKDVLILLAIDMNLPSLLNFCESSKSINEKVCKNNYFWYQKIEKDFPNENFLPVMPLKKKYILLYSLKDVKEKLNRKETLKELYELEELDLSMRGLDEVPNTIGNLINLKSLLLNNNNLIEIPDSIGNLYNLEILSLSFNKFKKFPEALEKLSLSRSPGLSKILEEFYYQGKSTEKIPDIVTEKGPKLKELYFSNNLLTKIPNYMGNFPNLQILNLHNNFFEEIPSSLGNLNNLEKLYLQNNLLTKFPDSLGNLRRLKLLDISQNKLKKIPYFIGNIQGLKQLYAIDTGLTFRDLASQLANINIVDWYF